MKLKKAIEIASGRVRIGDPLGNPDYIDALKLLIEAGKVLQHGRLIGAHHDPALLPGESND